MKILLAWKKGFNLSHAVLDMLDEKKKKNSQHILLIKMIGSVQRHG